MRLPFGVKCALWDVDRRRTLGRRMLATGALSAALSLLAAALQPVVFAAMAFVSGSLTALGAALLFLPRDLVSFDRCLRAAQEWRWD